MIKLAIVLGLFIFWYYPVVSQSLSLEDFIEKMHQMKPKTDFDQPRVNSDLSKLTFTQLNHQPQFQKQAFFCRVEDQLTKSSQLFVKFRIGSVAVMDRLEGYDRSLLPLDFPQTQYYYPANPLAAHEKE